MYSWMGMPPVRGFSHWMVYSFGYRPTGSDSRVRAYGLPETQPKCLTHTHCAHTLRTHTACTHRACTRHARTRRTHTCRAHTHSAPHTHRTHTHKLAGCLRCQHGTIFLLEGKLVPNSGDYQGHFQYRNSCITIAILL